MKEILHLSETHRGEYTIMNTLSAELGANGKLQ